HPAVARDLIAEALPQRHRPVAFDRREALGPRLERGSSASGLRPQLLGPLAQLPRHSGHFGQVSTRRGQVVLRSRQVFDRSGQWQYSSLPPGWAGKPFPTALGGKTSYAPSTLRRHHSSRRSEATQGSLLPQQGDRFEQRRRDQRAGDGGPDGLKGQSG